MKILDKTNIINFPNRNFNIDTPQTKEEVDDIIGDVRLYHIDQSMELIIPLLIEQFGMLSLPIDKIEQKDLIFVHEAIRYILFKMYDYSHPMGRIVEQTIREDEQLGMVFDSSKITTKKKVKLKQIKE